ncbi:putative structural protein [Dickeya phage vB_DsoM_JA13]|uniref:Putative structural protein n=1 Tax=Dickeya phage vB_DsoM_JA13 TaxID=2283030 RepID=A0A384ZWC0_9CAUD|nr:putative structural protein [Dickeya phage vB_DsoM_JA13]
MLYQIATDIVMSNEADLLPGEVIHEEGVALVWHRENGKNYLKLSRGVQGEIFAGFAMARNMPPAYQIMVEEFTIDATLAYTLQRQPKAGQTLVKIAKTKADEVTGGAAPDAGEVAFDGAELKFNSADIGKKVHIQYAWELSVSEARAITGDAPVGGLPTNIRQRVAYIKLGNISTNMIDASADWQNDTVLNPSLGAGGLLTIGGNGTLLKGVIIKKAPDATNGYATFELATPGV